LKKAKTTKAQQQANISTDTKCRAGLSASYRFQDIVVNLFIKIETSQ